MSEEKGAQVSAVEYVPTFESSVVVVEEMGERVVEVTALVITLLR